MVSSIIRHSPLILTSSLARSIEPTDWMTLGKIASLLYHTAAVLQSPRGATIWGGGSLGSATGATHVCFQIWNTDSEDHMWDPLQWNWDRRVLERLRRINIALRWCMVSHAKPETICMGLLVFHIVCFASKPCGIPMCCRRSCLEHDRDEYRREMRGTFRAKHFELHLEVSLRKNL